MTPTSIRAFENLKRLCEEHMHGAYKIQVVDLLERPMLARGDQIIAVPTLRPASAHSGKENYRRPFKH